MTGFEVSDTQLFTLKKSHKQFIQHTGHQCTFEQYMQMVWDDAVINEGLIASQSIKVMGEQTDFNYESGVANVCH